MNISLTPELEKAIKAKVASGLYNNASEIIREARSFFRLNGSILQIVRALHRAMDFKRHLPSK